MQLQMVPLDWTKEGVPRDVPLLEAVQEFAEKEFGAPLNFAYYARVHAALAIDEEGNRTVMGLLGIRYAIDVSMFHVVPLSQDREGYKLAEQARDMMFVRGHNYIADLGHTGSVVLVYVAEQAQRYWRRFLKRVGASPANRYEVKI